MFTKTTINLLSVSIAGILLSACHNHSTELPLIPESTSHQLPRQANDTTLSKVGVESLATPGSLVSPVSVTNNQKIINAFSALGFETEQTSNGVLIFLPNSAHFDTNVATLKPVTLSVLKQFSNEINKPYLANNKIIISGHTDSTGNEEANLELSKRRANAVLSAIAKFGNTDNRLKAIGFGETSPRFGESSKQELNRRVEFLIFN